MDLSREPLAIIPEECHKTQVTTSVWPCSLNKQSQAFDCCEYCQILTKLSASLKLVLGGLEGLEDSKTRGTRGTRGARGTQTQGLEGLEGLGDSGNSGDSTVCQSVRQSVSQLIS